MDQEQNGRREPIKTTIGELVNLVKAEVGDDPTIDPMGVQISLVRPNIFMDPLGFRENWSWQVPAPEAPDILNCEYMPPDGSDPEDYHGVIVVLFGDAEEAEEEAESYREFIEEQRQMTMLDPERET